MAEIELTQGKVALVDDEDVEMLSGFKWYAAQLNKGQFYAICHPSKHIQIRMHRILVDAPDGFDVDHANGNTLDNRKCNLRIATRSQNQANAKPRGGVSKYKGVSFHRNRWCASITKDKTRTHLGCFGSEEDAAKAYDAAAVVAYGEFARTNFPQGESISFTLPLSISKNHSHRNSRKLMVRRQDGKEVYQQRQVKTSKTERWIRDARIIMQCEVNKTGWTTTQKSDVKVTIDVYLRDLRSDAHNYEEVLFDAMQKLIYDNDRYVCQHTTTRYVDKDNPRVEVTVTK